MAAMIQNYISTVRAPLVLLLLAILVFSHFVQAAGPGSVGFSDLTAYMEQVLGRLKLQGAAVLVGRSDGTILYRRFFGDFTPATLVPVQSVTKWWTAATLE